AEEERATDRQVIRSCPCGAVDGPLANADEVELASGKGHRDGESGRLGAAVSLGDADVIDYNARLHGDAHTRAAEMDAIAHQIIETIRSEIGLSGCVSNNSGGWSSRVDKAMGRSRRDGETERIAVGVAPRQLD